MEDIYIKELNDGFYRPYVNFNSKQGICELEGESFLENAVEFYYPLIQWIEKYRNNVKNPLTFKIKLRYFNTSSSKSILELLNALKDFEDEGGDLTINWHYEVDNDQMLEDIEDYMIDTGLSINPIPY